MTAPRVTLHDVHVEGDGADPAAILAAIEKAVAQATTEGTPSTQSAESAVQSSLGPERR